MKLAVLEPGHFHAALLQKRMYAEIDPTVHVYAQDGPELQDYVQRIDAFNSRPENPTRWRLQVSKGADGLERLISDKTADIVVIAGNNQFKTKYLSATVDAGMHVLADKPMAIDEAGFTTLEQAFGDASANKVLLYDIMTERFEITTLLQKEFSMIQSVFGEQAKGTEQNPAVTKESVHYIAKQVSGSPIRRPAWFFDVAQQGDGLVDITTHLVDLVQWECFPGQILDYRKDIRIIGARRWPTEISPAQFEQVTGLASYPAFLRKDVRANGNLYTFANGEIDYVIKGVHAKVSVLWHFEAPAGGGDSHFSVMRGTRANLVIRQGKEESYQPALTIEPLDSSNAGALEGALNDALPAVQKKYAGVGVARSAGGWQVTVPARYHVGHEAHFGQVTEQFLAYVKMGALADWEVPNMLAKYYTTTTALAMARSVNSPASGS